MGPRLLPVPLRELSTPGTVMGKRRLTGVLCSVSVCCGQFPEGRWELLPSSSVSSPQLNITTRSPQDGGFLEVERLRLSSSVTEHPLPEYSPGSSYVVTIQGLTAAGAGAASLWEFQTNGSGKVCCVPVPPGWPRCAPWLRQLLSPALWPPGRHGGAWARRSCALQPALLGADPAPARPLPCCLLGAHPSSPLESLWIFPSRGPAPPRHQLPQRP